MLEAGLEIIRTLQSRGHLAYIAGGWVRDALLGKPGVDIDIATSASVMEVRQEGREMRNCKELYSTVT
jgi:tRNA nucleotidyltransferase (CCA-adding enzyme)